MTAPDEPAPGSAAPRAVQALGDWTPRELEANGRLLLERLREHFETLRSQPITTELSAKEISELLDEPLPHAAQAFTRVLDQTWQDVRPNLTQLRERAVRMVLEIRERDGKGQGELARVARRSRAVTTAPGPGQGRHLAQESP